MRNNSSSKLALLVPILCQNWQFWGPNCIANKKIGNFFAKILKFCFLQSRIELGPIFQLPNLVVLVFSKLVQLDFQNLVQLDFKSMHIDFNLCT